VDIDLSVLRVLEREKEIPFKELVEIIEAAILAAYHRTVGNTDKARAVLDQKTGHVQIFATKLDEEGNEAGETESTPDGFGRIAASAAKQVIASRLRRRLRARQACARLCDECFEGNQGSSGHSF